jgi:hypothetical protein
MLLDALETPRGQAILHAAFVGANVVDTPPSVAPAPAPAQKPKLKKVLVAGLLGMQAESVKRQFGDKFDLRFLYADDKVSRVREQARHADVAIGMVGFISHKQEPALQACPDYRRVSNGVTSLKTVLTAMTGD